MSKIFGWILGIGTLLGAVYLWWSKRNNIADLKTALEVQKTREHIAKLEAIQADRLADVASSQERIDSVSEAIAANRIKAVALATEVDLTGKSAADIAKIFSDSGL